MEKAVSYSRVEGSLTYPSYVGQVNFSYISLQNAANRLHVKKAVGSAKRVTHTAGSPIFDGRVKGKERKGKELYLSV